MDATVAILAYNGAEYLEALLGAVYAQKTNKKFEVLVIDSGSTDDTLSIVKRFPAARLHQIPNSEFGHGKTRNLAVKLAEGKFVLFLTQDAVPAGVRWLDSMLEPFEISQQVSCVFGKQIPRSDCFTTIKREVTAVFAGLGSDSAIMLHRKNELTDTLGLTLTFFSDVNSAVRVSAMHKVPFRDVNYAEDQALGEDMLKAGYIKAYTPLGSVYHSHDYPLRKYFHRKFDEYVGIRETTGQTITASLKELTVGTLKSTVQDWRFIMHDKDFGFLRKLHDALLCPFYNLALRLAIRTAAKASNDKKLQQKLSLEAKQRKQSG